MSNLSEEKSIQESFINTSEHTWIELFPLRVRFSLLKYLPVIAIAKCQRANISPIRAHCRICLEMSWKNVIDEN